VSGNLQHTRASRATSGEQAPTAAGIPGMPEATVQLSIPDEGIRGDGVVLRLPRAEDIDVIVSAFADPEIREAGNLPNFSREEMQQAFPHLPRLVASGRMLPLTVVDAASGDVLGGGTLHHLDAERASIEIGYWLMRHARGRGVATQIARLLAGHAFSLGVQRVEAYVNVGNDASDRVLERANFTREGVARSLAKPDRTRVDKTQYSLLPGE
jgi:RimJ/RimL family protein N-acetyltransferase